MSHGYQLVLFANAAQEESTGYVFCADDQKARVAAEALLRNRPDLIVVHVYEDDRLVWQIVRDGDDLRALD